MILRCDFINSFVPVIIRTADAATGVDFDPDCFIDTIQNMLGQSVARQPSPGSDSEGTLSGDDLSISSEESVTSDPGECDWCVGVGGEH